jgi:hypothetical protein
MPPRDCMNAITPLSFSIETITQVFRLSIACTVQYLESKTVLIVRSELQTIRSFISSQFPLASNAQTLLRVYTGLSCPKEYIISPNNRQSLGSESERAECREQEVKVKMHPRPWSC